MAESLDDHNTESKLDQAFENATKHVRKLTNISEENMLRFYGLYKQANEGKCTTSKPAFWDFVGKAKWEAWRKLGGMSKDEAKMKYINVLKEIDPGWIETNNKDQISTKANRPKKSQGMGVAVSTMYHNEDDIVSDEEKTVFDWCKEGNVKKVTSLLESDVSLLNSVDEQEMTLLHWACDRGHEEIVKILISRGAGLNKQDSELQTPLHYAAVCEFENIVKILLGAGADSTIEDDTGCTPAKSTTNKAMQELFENQRTLKSDSNVS